MRKRTEQIIKHITSIVPQDVKTVLDVGAGNGQIPLILKNNLHDVDIVACDTLIQRKLMYPVTKINNELPYQNNSFDLVMLVDVLHHTDNIKLLLNDCVRVSRKYILIKDHLSNNLFDKLQLSLMDIVGNFGSGVGLSYNYPSTQKWDDFFRVNNLRVVKSLNNLGLYHKPLSYVCDRDLHFIKLAVKDH